jgi:dTDP-4-amino-4,6-dideoxygalactose transaminase
VKSVIDDFLGGRWNEDEIKNAFAAHMAEYLDCRHVVPVSNGTAALEVALRGLGLSRGDCVIVPDISFIATATAVANCGLVPVYADVSPEYFGLTADSLQSRDCSRVKAVILVHFSGFVNRDLFEIIEYCCRRGLLLVEDCAQAFSCTAHGRKVGTFGDAGTFSFQSSKIISAGEGGLVCTDKKDPASLFQAISDWGMSPAFAKRRLELASSNFRLSALQCYCLDKKLRSIEQTVAARINRCAQMEEACRTLGLEHRLPAPKQDFIDCPFFFPVKSARKLNTVEPREESPMHRSSMVPAILRRFYPDLLETYFELNPPDVPAGFCSNNVIADIDFINIHQTGDTPAEEVLTAYTEALCLK